MSEVEKKGFLEYVQKIIAVKHGRVILVGGIAILATIMMIGIFAAAGLHSSTKTEIKNTPKLSQSPVVPIPKDSDKITDQSPYGDLKAKFSATESLSECDNRFPDNGFIKIFRKDWAAANMGKSDIQIDNKTENPIWLKLTHPTAGFPVWAIMVYPFETITERVNIGLYGVEFSYGTKWCNQNVGMTEAKTLSLAKNLPITKTNSTLLRITSDSSGQLDAVLVELPRMTGEGTSGPMVIEKK